MSKKPYQQLTELKKKKKVLIIFVGILIIVMIWIIVEVFAIKEPLILDKELEDVAKPLEVNIDEELLSSLKYRDVFDESELTDFPVYRKRGMEYKKFRTVAEIEKTLDVSLTFDEFVETQKDVYVPEINVEIVNKDYAEEVDNRSFDQKVTDFVKNLFSPLIPS